MGSGTLGTTGSVGGDDAMLSVCCTEVIELASESESPFFDVGRREDRRMAFPMRERRDPFTLEGDEDCVDSIDIASESLCCAVGDREAERVEDERGIALPIRERNAIFKGDDDWVDSIETLSESERGDSERGTRIDEDRLTALSMRERKDAIDSESADEFVSRVRMYVRKRTVKG
jgi:hypothetical protein